MRSSSFILVWSAGLLSATPAFAQGPCRGDGAPSCPEPARPACQTVGPLAGQCTECSPSDRSLCVAPRALCLFSAGRCVECATNGNCGGPRPYCDPAVRACRFCEGDGAPSCVGPDGPVCLASGACGCLRDADCGGPGSAKVCDQSKRVCVKGCRGIGGNGCAAGSLCDSSSDARGECVPISSGESVEGASAPRLAGGGGLCSGDERASLFAALLALAALLSLKLRRRRNAQPVRRSR